MNNLIAQANNFAGRSLTPEEHDVWKDIKAALEAKDKRIVDLQARVDALEANEGSIISLLESLETTLCTGDYNDRVANALALIAEIMALEGEGK